MGKNVFIGLILISVFCVFPAFAQQQAGPVGIFLNHHAARNFIAGEISREHLDIIIQAGVRAPSARNLQPWHFTVVQNEALARQILPQSQAGNVHIVVSAAGDGRTNGVQILDSALAIQSIYLAAQALGYGSRIYTGHNDRINRTLRTALALPPGHNIVGFVRVGRVDAALDGISGPSPRRQLDEVVSFM
ncbi:MAG: nitroreductase family protein [Spirochaetes bacterium]|nr:nitroreductase family protein [Spirochaetota bacterium]